MIKICIIILAGTEAHEGLGRLVNALETAKELKEAGDEVALVFDGAGTEGLATLLDPDHKMNPLLMAVQDKVTGACYHCAGAFGVREWIEPGRFPLLSEYHQHPSLRRFIVQDYRLLVF